jgi:hypothetical protein
MVLTSVLPAVEAVESYWHGVEPENSTPEPELWKPAQHYGPDQLDYIGPGGFLISFGQRVVCISASARWSGFLTIEPLRNVHLAAFRSISRSVGGTRLLLLPDAMDERYHAISEALSQEQCVARLREKYGPPQPSVTAIPPGAFTAAIPGSHLVWFSEVL